MAFLQSMWQNSVQAVQGTGDTALTKEQSRSRADLVDTAVISACMHIKGNMTGNGNVELLGSISGDIKIAGKLHVTGSITGNSSAAEVYTELAKIVGEIKSESSIEIGTGTVVIGNVFAASAVIAGAVKGDIDVRGPVILDSSAIVMGNIKSEALEIINGAVVEGVCSQCYGDSGALDLFRSMETPA